MTQAEQVKNAIIDGGGTFDGRPWFVGIRSPEPTKRFGCLVGLLYDSYGELTLFLTRGTTRPGNVNTGALSAEGVRDDIWQLDTREGFKRFNERLGRLPNEPFPVMRQNGSILPWYRPDGSLIENRTNEIQYHLMGLLDKIGQDPSIIGTWSDGCWGNESAPDYFAVIGIIQGYEMEHGKRLRYGQACFMHDDPAVKGIYEV